MVCAILGSHGQLALAELASLYGSAVSAHNELTALIEHDNVALSHLGGTVKLASVIEIVPSSRFSDVEKSLAGILARLGVSPGQKFTLGFSFYNLPGAARSYQGWALGFKKSMSEHQGYKLRMVIGKKPQLSAAELTYNKLLGSDRGAEIIVSIGADTTVIARTTEVFDMEAYGERDYGRPRRNARVGMMPPKLAQMLLNLTGLPPGSTILDPFCGSGTILQEGLLLGYNMVGSDISRQILQDAQDNLAWLGRQHRLQPSWQLLPANATAHRFNQPIAGVVTEGYLGSPRSREPSEPELRKLEAESLELYTAFLKNMSRQLPPGAPVVLTVPAWRLGKRYYPPPLIDQISNFGYTLKSLAPADERNLLYARPDQIVGRYTLALIKE